jgi:hypothetical protein
MYDSAFFAGVDLGKLTNPSAVAVVERSPILGPEGIPLRTSVGTARHRYAVRGLRRFPLGESYENIALFLGKLLGRPDVPGCKICLDCTGVGIGVLERIDAVIGRRSLVHPVVITAGHHVTTKDRYVHCPKHVLAGCLRSTLECGDILVADELEHAQLLKQELLSFEVRISRAAHEIIEAESGAYDDLVIATALTVFLPIWLESQHMFIAGPPLKVVLPETPRSPAQIAATMGGHWTRPSVPYGPGGPLPKAEDPARKGWTKVGTPSSLDLERMTPWTTPQD